MPEHLRGTYAGLGTATVTELPARPRRHGRRAAAGAPVRRRARRRRPRADQLLGLQLDRLPRPARRLQRVRRPRPAGHRVQADGEALPRGRASRCTSTSSTTTPPRPAPTARRTPSAGSTTRASTSAPRRPTAGRVLGRHRLRQHRRLDEPGGAAADPRLAALLGDRDARRRVPLRPRLGSRAHRARRRHAGRLPHHHRPGPGAPLREADRGAVGREHGRLPRRLVPAAVGGVERPLPRHHARLLARPTPTASATSPRGSPAPRTSTPTTAARRTRR